MPYNRSLYPHDWDKIALQVKENARWVCQNCGKPCRPPSVPLKETKEWLIENRHFKWLDDLFGFENFQIRIKNYAFTLTTAHLNHISEDCRPENLRAWCAPCHCRYDAEHHAQTRKSKKQKRIKELKESGQLSLF